MEELIQLRDVLHEEIPLTRAMGVEVVASQDNCLTLTAPLSPNTNHKSTAFGGSLYSLAVLTGWGLLHLKLKQHDVAAHIVIRQSHIDYIRPVTDDITAICCLESEQQLDRMLHTYNKKHIAAIRLNAMIRQGDAHAVLFSGKYVIHK